MSEMRRVFRLEEIKDFTELSRGDIFVMFENDNGESMENGQPYMVFEVDDETYVAADKVRLIGNYADGPVLGKIPNWAPVNEKPLNDN